jgi:hypothetical protein
VLTEDLLLPGFIEPLKLLFLSGSLGFVVDRSRTVFTGSKVGFLRLSVIFLTFLSPLVGSLLGLLLSLFLLSCLLVGSKKHRVSLQVSIEPFLLELSLES